jgi:hypothetical protein
MDKPTSDIIPIPLEGGVIVFNGDGGVSAIGGLEINVTTMNIISIVLSHIHSGEYVYCLSPEMEKIDDAINEHIDHRTSEVMQ